MRSDQKVSPKTQSISNNFLRLLCSWTTISKTFPKKLEDFEENWERHVSARMYSGREVAKVRPTVSVLQWIKINDGHLFTLSLHKEGMTKPGIIRYYKTQSQCVRTSTRFRNCDQISEILPDFRTSTRFHNCDKTSQCRPNFTISQPNFTILAKFLNFNRISEFQLDFWMLTKFQNFYQQNY